MWCLPLILLFSVLSAGAQEEDPFADVRPKENTQTQDVRRPWAERFTSENFGIRKEIMSQAGVDDDGEWASRQSLGVEMLKKFSTDTRTFAAMNFQGRLVRRDHRLQFPNDMEGMERADWAFEYHNAYVDLYNFADPILSDQGKASNMGRFNARFGRFYIPFGLNTATDTHGTLLQLSNDENFGFERDWYTGLWGGVGEGLRYDINYLVGSGYDLKYRGQAGMLSARLSLSNQYLNDYGLEGGLSYINGERLGMEGQPMDTVRGGADIRYRASVPGGLATWTSELSGGEDQDREVLTQLHQADYLHSSRRWGLSGQYRWFQDMRAALLAEFSWYFRNDVAGSNLHWIKLNCQTDTERQQGDRNVVWTTQYYYYF